MLSKGQKAILKIAAVLPYLLTTEINFEQTNLDIERNSYARFQRNSSSGFGTCDNGENQSWSPAAIFVDGPEPFLGMQN